LKTPSTTPDSTSCSEPERAGAAAGIASAEFEPGMLPPTTRLLRRFATMDHQHGYLAFLEKRIQRDPRNLRAHVERVQQRAALADADGLYAALIDLNLTLGVHGHGLRSQLLARFSDLLDPPQREFLEAHLVSGIDAEDPGATVAGVLLSRQIAGTTRIVTRRGDAVASPGALAIEASTNGDAAMACELLEEALEFDPGRADLSAELLALCRRTGRRQDFERARTRLLGRRLALAAQWEQTAAWFRSQDAGHDEPSH